MGITGSMKKKFNLPSFRMPASKPPDPSTLQSFGNLAAEEFQYDSDSPPYSPTLSEMERPLHRPDVLFELRGACAILVAMTNPPEPDEEDQLEQQRQLLRHYEKERLTKAEAQKSAKSFGLNSEATLSLISPPNPAPPLRHQNRAGSTHCNAIAIAAAATAADDDISNFSSKPTGRRVLNETMVAIDAKEPPVSKPRAHDLPLREMSSRSPVVTRKQSIPRQMQAVPHVELDPIRFPHQGINGSPRGERRPRGLSDTPAVDQTHSGMHCRPKTSAAACVDYQAPPTDLSSATSSRANSDCHGFRISHASTGMTSVQMMTPSVGGSNYHDSMLSHASRTGSSKDIRDLARQRASEQAGLQQHGSRPASRSSKLSRMTSASDLNQARPGSRAGSLASSIASGFQNYIRPRASQSNVSIHTVGSGNDDESSIRSGRSSALGLSRSQSRSSSVSRQSGGWFRNGGLRRQGSWASFRSGGRGESSENKGRRSRKEEGPNLNRPLPALPGLDQYKESKTHIGQLVKTSGKRKIKKSAISAPQPCLPIDTPYTATLPFATTAIRSNSQSLRDPPVLMNMSQAQTMANIQQAVRRSTHPEYESLYAMSAKPKAEQRTHSEVLVQPGQMSAHQFPKVPSASCSPSYQATKFDFPTASTSSKPKLRASTSITFNKPRRSSGSVMTSDSSRHGQPMSGISPTNTRGMPFAQTSKDQLNDRTHIAYMHTSSSAVSNSKSDIKVMSPRFNVPGSVPRKQSHAASLPASGQLETWHSPKHALGFDSSSPQRTFHDEAGHSPSQLERYRQRDASAETLCSPSQIQGQVDANDSRSPRDKNALRLNEVYHQPPISGKAKQLRGEENFALPTRTKSTSRFKFLSGAGSFGTKDKKDKDREREKARAKIEAMNVSAKPIASAQTRKLQDKYLQSYQPPTGNMKGRPLHQPIQVEPYHSQYPHQHMYITLASQQDQQRLRQQQEGMSPVFAPMQTPQYSDSGHYDEHQHQIKIQQQQGLSRLQKMTGMRKIVGVGAA